MFRKYPKPKILWHLEELGIILFLLTIPMQNLGIIKGFTFAKLFLMATFSYFFIRASLRKDPWLIFLPFRSWTCLAILVFIITMLPSAFAAEDLSYVYGTISRYVTLYLCVLLIASIAKAKRHVLYALVAAIIIGASANAAAGLYELATKKMVLKGVSSGTLKAQKASSKSTNLPGRAGGRRILGFDGGPGEHAVHFNVYAALAIIVPFLTRNFWLRTFGILLVFIFLINAVGAGSRTGLIGMALEIIVFVALIEMRHKKLLILALGIAAIAAVYIFDLPIARLFGQTAATKQTQSFRVEQARTAMDMISKHPIVGVGAGNFTQTYLRYQNRHPTHDRLIALTVMHCGLLNQLTECGLIGFFGLLLVLGVVYSKLFILRFKAKLASTRVIAVAIRKKF